MLDYNESGALDSQITVSLFYIENAERISNHSQSEFEKLEERYKVFTAWPYLCVSVDGSDL